MFQHAASSTRRSYLSLTLLAVSIISLVLMQFTPAVASQMISGSTNEGTNATAISDSDAAIPDHDTVNPDGGASGTAGNTDSTDDPADGTDVSADGIDVSADGTDTAVDTASVTAEAALYVLPQILPNDTFGDFEVTGDTSSVSFDAATGVLIISGGEHIIAMASGKTSTTQKIYVAAASTITLQSVQIQATDGPAFAIADDAAFDVHVILNNLQSGLLTVPTQLETTADGCAGLQKNGGSGTLFIDELDTQIAVSTSSQFQITGGLNAAALGGGDNKGTQNITIGINTTSGLMLSANGGAGGAGIGGGNGGSANNIYVVHGSITATGGSNAAGIGGGNGGNGNDIAVTGGDVTLQGGSDAAALGGGASGSGSQNSLTNNGVLYLISGSPTREIADGFSFSHGILFTKKGLDASASWNPGEIKGDVNLSGYAGGILKVVADLTIAENQTLDVGNWGITILTNATLSNKGIIQVGTGMISNEGVFRTWVAFYNANGALLAQNWQNYSATYANFPDTSGITDFDGWYTKPNKQGGQKISDATYVHINQHSLYVHLLEVPFLVTGDGVAEDSDYRLSTATKQLEILTDKPMSITLVQGYTATDWQIAINQNNTAGANLTLAGVSIETDSGAALEIPDNYAANVTILLADDSANTLFGKAAYESTGEPGAPGIQKNEGTGKLSIGVPVNAQKRNGSLDIKGGDGAAGIGGVGIPSGKTEFTISNIEIAGGHVETKGGFGGAGIGGGVGGNGTNITISGGNVFSTGGTYAAGIGGGRCNYLMASKPGGTGSFITLNGAEVHAQGGLYGAGIGGGEAGNGSNITISGGNVFSTGGAYAAGIGGGKKYINLPSPSESRGGNGTSITVNAGEVHAEAGGGAAGIGGASEGNGEDITLAGGVIVAKGGHYTSILDSQQQSGAGIGGGSANATDPSSGTGTRNKIEGNVAVFASSGGEDTGTGGTKKALQGFESASQGAITQGVVYSGVGTTFDNNGVQSETSWQPGYVYGQVELTTSVTLPASLNIAPTTSLIIAQGATLTVPQNVAVKNGGTLVLNDNAILSQGATIETLAHFYREGQTTPYITGYQVFQTAQGTQTYIDLPNPDANDMFVNWYYTNDSSQEVPIQDGSPVLLNQHDFYEKRADVAFTVTPCIEGEGTIQLNTNKAVANQLIEFSLIPAAGYQVKSGSLTVLASDAPVSYTQDTDNAYSFVMPDANVDIHVVFEPTPGPTPPAPTPEPAPSSDIENLFPSTGDTTAALSLFVSLGLAASVLLGVAYRLVRKDN